VDSRLEGLNLESIEALERDGKEFAALESYARDTHGATHSHLKPKIQEIFKLKRKGESEPYEANGYHELDDGKRRLLWHGSRTTNFGGTHLDHPSPRVLKFLDHLFLARYLVTGSQNCPSRSSCIRIHVRSALDL